MKCPSCGAETKSAKYCEYCGSELPKNNSNINITNNYYGNTTAPTEHSSTGGKCPMCSSLKGLPDRWCIGFNHPNSDQLIEMLNIQNRFVVADKDPKSWVTADGQSYSIVLLPGVLDAEPSKELEQRLNLCLQVIQTVTFRQLNPITL